MILHSRQDVPFLPLPNVVEFIADSQLAPISLTSTAFMVTFTRARRLILAHNCRRGLEIPGGHIEPGETPCRAGVREGVEETGHHVSHIRAIGYQKMTTRGSRPLGYRYPHPISYQQFFVGESMYADEYQVNDECTMPVEISMEEACTTLNAERLAIVELAYQIMFEKA